MTTSEKGQIEILDASQWYTKSGEFDAAEVVQGWVEKEEQAIKNGFDGLRLAGNTFWLEGRDWKAFLEYEATVDSVIGQHRMIAICSYSLDRCTAAEVIEVVRNHQSALIRSGGKWASIESTERKQAQEALRESEELHRITLSNMSDAVFITVGRCHGEGSGPRRWQV